VGQTRYTLERALGRGPHGEQRLLASRLEPSCSPLHVLLKALPSGAEAERSLRLMKARARLEEEVRLGAYLRHPGIARVHGRHETADALYVETEHVAGYTLDDVVFLSLACGHSFSESFLLHVGMQAARALAFAHARSDERGLPLGLVHRDLNPQSIRLGLEGEVKLTDWGDAASNLRGRVPSSLTRQHGEAFYAAPEVLFAEAVDARADLFSLGLVLLEVATGLHLYNLPHVLESELEARLTGEGEARVHRSLVTAMEAGLCVDDYESTALHAAAYQPEDLDLLTARLPAPLRAILHLLLQREPSARYATADELEAALRSRLDALGPYAGGAAAHELQETLTRAGRRLMEFERSVAAPLSDSALRARTPVSA
jgi:serine/threonine-protein kinase